MLQNTFIHVSGVGAATERRLWDRGFLTWDVVEDGASEGLSPSQAGLLEPAIAASRRELAEGNAAYFGKRLPAGEQWRLFADFRDNLAYVDIESDGLDMVTGGITTIALYDGRSVHTYVDGQNLSDFIADIEKYDVLVTYNGKTFDVPYLQRYFGIELPQAHIDLRYVLASLGFKGGLKRCEKQLGVDRGGLDGVDGYFAVLLWNEYRNAGNERALETLLAYNIEDVINLEILLVESFNRKIAGTPFAETHCLPFPTVPPNPFRPDLLTVDRLKRRIFGDPSGAYFRSV